MTLKGTSSLSDGYSGAEESSELPGDLLDEFIMLEQETGLEGLQTGADEGPIATDEDQKETKSKKKGSRSKSSGDQDVPKVPKKRGPKKKKMTKERVMKLKQRRIKANTRERSRMHGLNEALDVLRKYVPCYSQTQKLSKIETLRLARNYISALADILKSGVKPDGVTFAKALTKGLSQNTMNLVAGSLQLNPRTLLPDNQLPKAYQYGMAAGAMPSYLSPFPASMSFAGTYEAASPCPNYSMSPAQYEVSSSPGKVPEMHQQYTPVMHAPSSLPSSASPMTYDMTSLPSNEILNQINQSPIHGDSQKACLPLGSQTSQKFTSFHSQQPHQQMNQAYQPCQQMDSPTLQPGYHSEPFPGCLNMNDSGVDGLLDDLSDFDTENTEIPYHITRNNAFNLASQHL